MKTIIKAEIVAHSVNEQGDELISVLATFPRIILAEVNTHRMLSKNTSSSRAIPFAKMVESVKNDTFIPIAWQKEHKGMQGTEYFTDSVDLAAIVANWLLARDRAVSSAWWLNEGKLTKQLCNRLLEPFMWTTMLITGPKSGWDNFFKLRCPIYSLEVNDEDGVLNFRSKTEAIEISDGQLDTWTDLDWLKVNKGQAEIHMMSLAECIWDSYNESTPRVLKAGEWHIPFEDKINIKSFIGKTSGKEVYNLSHLKEEEQEGIIEMDKAYNKALLELPVKISVAMAARTSYTVVGEEKALDYEAMIGLHDRLLAWDPPHSSPLEHAAKCMSEAERQMYRKVEKTKGDSEGLGWCNNFKGFIPYRYMVDNAQL